jgi:XPG domain containing
MRLLADNDRKAICFDGALPLNKQATRLERLEKARGLLERYRKQRPGPFKPSTSENSHSSASALESSIWKKRLLALKHKDQLPPAPFIVACVLDDLRNDWKSEYHVLVVPGEADSYCASIARTTGAAILSNDSDMTMYDLGSEGSLVLLDTLDLELGGGVNHEGKRQDQFLKARRLHPLNIARRLSLTTPIGNPSLLRFGFERLNDPSTPTGTIRSRLTGCLSAEASEAFEDFCKLYTDLKEIESAEAVVNVLVQLDPRLSELYCQYNCKEYVVHPPHSPHIYMPPLVEDPTRDSSWTYGKDLRILAYSLLKISAENNGNLQHSDRVIEFQRRGPRIVGVPLKVLSRVELVSSMEATVRDLCEHDFTVGALLQWRLIGLKKVNMEKARHGKPTLSHAWVAEFLRKGYAGDSLSWDDIHTYANVQACLYSFWILKQACAVSKSRTYLRPYVDSLTKAIQPLVSLRRLVESRWEILSSSQNLPDAVIAEALGQLDLQHIGPEQNSTVNNIGSRSDDGSNHTTSKAILTARDQRWRANGNIFELLASP